MTLDWSIGLSHIALMVRNPERSAALFETLFDITATREPAGPSELSVPLAGTRLVFVRGDPPTARNDDHLAFVVAAVELPMLAERLASLGIEHRLSREQTAASLYFVDYDNHLYELHAERLGNSFESDGPGEGPP